MIPSAKAVAVPQPLATMSAETRMLYNRSQTADGMHMRTELVGVLAAGPGPRGCWPIFPNGRIDRSVYPHG
jgi:hypothetical protein